jgi:predicted DNA binding CopG/RHH family protein
VKGSEVQDVAKILDIHPFILSRWRKEHRKGKLELMGDRHTKTMKNKIPRFKSEAKERAFWAVHDSSEFVDWSKARKVVLANLRPSVKSISIRLPESMLEELRLLANKRDVPYQSLLKMYLADRLESELKHSHA